MAFLLCAADTASDADEERKVEFGFEQRVRNENWNNIFDFSDKMDDEREQIRYRTIFWSKIPLSSNVDFFASVNQETNQKMAKVNQFDEVIVDNAYLDIKKLFTKGLSLRIGRQNITKGEGFLFFEGEPGDGSRAIYFNAVDLAYSRRKSKLEFIGLVDPARDRFLPRIHDQRKVLQDWDDQGMGVYYVRQPVELVRSRGLLGLLRRRSGDKKQDRKLGPAFQPLAEMERAIHLQPVQGSGGRLLDQHRNVAGRNRFFPSQAGELQADLLPHECLSPVPGRPAHLRERHRQGRHVPGARGHRAEQELERPRPAGAAHVR